MNFYFVVYYIFNTLTYEHLGKIQKKEKKTKHIYIYIYISQTHTQLHTDKKERNKERNTPQYLLLYLHEKQINCCRSERS